jgi:hypothetical protein
MSEFIVLPAHLKPLIVSDGDQGWYLAVTSMGAGMCPGVKDVAPRVELGQRECHVFHPSDLWYCTRVQGHDGSHVAHTTMKTVAVWKRKEKRDGS